MTVEFTQVNFYVEKDGTLTFTISGTDDGPVEHYGLYIGRLVNEDVDGMAELCRWAGNECSNSDFPDSLTDDEIAIFREELTSWIRNTDG